VQDGPASTGPDCSSCERLARTSPPPRDLVVETGGWVVAHAFNANLEGWLVMLPRRHVVALDELTVGEADALGPLLRALTSALRDVTGCEKTYALLLAESEGFHHLHVHVVPRHRDLDPALRGARIFGLLGNPDLGVINVERMDELAIELRAHLRSSGAVHDGDVGPHRGEPTRRAT
jgi:diadenosine tetraphosphate (Ap4A) HIT family hydrolase